MPSNRTRTKLRTVAATLAAAALLGAIIGVAALKGGWYHIGATSQHWQFVHSALEQGMRDSVRHHSQDIVAPPLDDALRIERGAAVYRDNCMQCHGAPGVAQANFGKSMQPVPGPLVDAARRWRPRELYWITRHGIKMSGMPAWEFHLSEDALWSVVAFVQKLPELSAPAYADMMKVRPGQMERASEPLRARGDPERGRIAVRQYACNACHMIPGVTGPEVYVGRPLEGLAERKYIAGYLPNTQANLMRWIRNPKSVDPITAMPVLDVTEQDALDISTYLLSDPKPFFPN